MKCSLHLGVSLAGRSSSRKLYSSNPGTREGVSMQPNHPQLEGLETRRLFAFGKTDTTFGDQGRTEAAVDNANGSQATKDLLVTSGGKIIAGGDAGLIRFNS